MSFEAPPKLDPDNPLDVAKTARRLVQRLAEQPDNRSTVDDLLEQHFGHHFTEEMVRIAAESIVIYDGIKIKCDGQELWIKYEHEIKGYLDKLKNKGPGDPLDLLELREKQSVEDKEMECIESMDSE